METTNCYYINRIKEDLSLRQRSNPHYSLRAYARDLGLHSSSLSQVLQGKRSLPIKNSLEVVKKLGLTPKERTLFLESLYKKKTSIDDIEIDQNDSRFILDESYHKVIAEWEHYLVLDLFDLHDFEFSIAEVAQRLGITENRAEVVVNNLLTSGLLSNTDGVLKKEHEYIRTTEDVKSQALKEAHIEALELGKQKLDEVEVELRDISLMTIAMDTEKLPEAKVIIREFRQKMMALLRDGKKNEVYQLAIQFYPMTKTKKQ